MYARKYDKAAPKGESAPVRLPEQYHGNAFTYEDAEEEEALEEKDCPRSGTEVHSDSPLFSLSKLFSPDLLLLLLAFLLMGSEGGDELSGILILLLLL